MSTLGKSIVVLAVMTAAFRHAGADDFRVGEIYAGYSLLHGDLQKHASGWEFSLGKNLNQAFSLHADIDAHHQSASGSLRHQHDFLLGPQFEHRTKRFTLFVHSLAGACKASGSAGSDTGFAAVAGGGVDWDLGFWSLRLAQIDYHGANVFGRFQHDSRFSIGLVFTLWDLRIPHHRDP